MRDEEGWTQEQIARAKGVSRSVVANRLRYNDKLPDEIKEFVSQEKISEAHLREIMQLFLEKHFSSWLTTEQLWIDIAKKARTLTTRETKEEIAQLETQDNENEGKSHEVIGGILGMSRTSITYHYNIISDLAPNILNIVEDTFVTQNQKDVTIDENSHVTTDVTRVTWQFSWFRHITPLPHRYQHHIVNRIIENADKTTT